MTGTPRRDRYHHGDLRTALVDTGFDLLAESGLAEFSVARVARRLGVSTAAPYRHFPDRDHLLAAVATRAATELAAEVERAVDAAGSDPVDRFAASGGAYVRFAATRGAGFAVIFAVDLRDLRDEALSAAGRHLMDRLLDLAREAIGGDTERALWLLEQQVALAHGYVALLSDGFFARPHHTIDHLAVQAERAARTLIRGLEP
ncbi:TetR/AcrR family transcriptional regulator [Umezawaea endophytica]|uniref:TetR/AcrR family transcriptional regulator n=1 Tax=Umezawaea endophytica TaxID=1654476 RepID=A0A9X3AF04_9PSEU|nr:TetR/AcrR family transcriptional regulator [Umezawaea endophytica]MCS7477601.1 TetR/AcrR family transcriptional regulator [Umezawaea endophytica]